jgi:secondary thiamine-phosphate synthase enzyme
VLRILDQSLRFSTTGEIQFIDLTGKIQKLVSESQVKRGIAHVFAPHATGIIIITEDDWNLLEDIRRTLENLIPKRAQYSHPSNAHAHLRSILFSPDKTLPIVNGRLALGTWQSIFYVETDVHPRQRTVIIDILGE